MPSSPLPSQEVEDLEPLQVGVFGCSLNPIHLSYSLLAITTFQTQPVDSVVLVLVFKHPWKIDLLPFED